MAYFPLFVDLRNRPCLVVGGGRVAAVKVKALLDAGASVSVASPDVTASLKKLIRRHRIRWTRRSFRRADLKSASLVIAATNDQKLNRQISRLAKQRAVPVNVVDQPALCTFIFPSIVRRGRLLIAVSTGGASPALSKWIRRDLESRYGATFNRLLEVAAKRRPRVLASMPGAARRKKLLEKALKAYLRVLGETDRRS